MLLNVAKCHGYSFYRVSELSRENQPGGGGREIKLNNTPLHPPHPPPQKKRKKKFGLNCISAAKTQA